MRPSPQAGAPFGGAVPPAAPSAQPEVQHTVFIEFNGMLTCTAGALEGQHFDIGSGVIIGRDPQVATIVVADSRISSKHVWIGKSGSSVVVRDMGSTNGTYVNQVGTRITESPLKNGDIIILADDAIRFRFTG